jgi:UDP-N-acetylmuramoylalanine--D-glutamate ligase
MSDWTGKRVVILGAARQGVALARWLTKHGAFVTVSDKRPETELKAAFEALNGADVKWIVGGHPVELLEGADLLCLSGGVSLTQPIIEEAIKRGLPLSNDTQIFMEAVPCKTVGIPAQPARPQQQL